MKIALSNSASVNSEGNVGVVSYPGHTVAGQVFEAGHYENLPMQYTEIFSGVKIENFVGKFLIFFLFLLKT